jgi:hypothetical protein
MSFLHSLLSLPREGLIVTGAVVAGLLVIWFFTLFVSRRRFVIIKRSEETEFIAFHLRRIADALERLATAREAAQPPVETGPSKHVGMSMLGH